MCDDQVCNLAKLVGKLNVEFYSQLERDDDEGIIVFELHSTGHEHVICFMDREIWASENDLREYDYDKDEYEPLEPFIRKEANRILYKITHVVI
jgi:hypothetical protein